MVVEKWKERMEIEHAQVEPDGEHIQQIEDELAKILLIC